MADKFVTRMLQDDTKVEMKKKAKNVLTVWIASMLYALALILYIEHTPLIAPLNSVAKQLLAYLLLILVYMPIYIVYTRRNLHEDLQTVQGLEYDKKRGILGLCVQVLQMKLDDDSDIR